MVATREGLEIVNVGDIQVYLPASAMNDSDAKEFTSNGRYEKSVEGKSAGRFLLDDIAFKADFIRTFDVVKPKIDLKPGHCVLELGAAHGWASVIAKDDCPDSHIVAADVVPDMLQHCRKYEEAIGRRIDEKWGFSVRDIPFADDQFDRIFTFAAFHHFGDHGDYSKSFGEIVRILKPGGKLVLLYEPCTPAMLYKPAYNRVNRRRAHEGVDEDVLVVSRLRKLAARHGLNTSAEPFPIYSFRSSVFSGIYYYVLSKLNLGSWFVCTGNLVFEKPERSGGATDLHL